MRPFKPLLMLGGLLLGLAVQAADMSPEAIAERIRPVGEVYRAKDLEGIAGAASGQAATAPAGPRDGATVYQGACMACHGTGALGAPLKGNKEAWAPRLAQGFDTLLGHALNGFNQMPARGTCTNCSDEEIAAAIRFMTDGL